MKALFAVAFLTLGLAGCSSDTDCKSGCDKLNSCGYKSSGFSCDENCEEPDCAACINDTACADIPSACASACPGKTFTK